MVGSLQSSFIDALKFKILQWKACYTLCAEKDVKCHLKIVFAMFVLDTEVCFPDNTALHCPPGRPPVQLMFLLLAIRNVKYCQILNKSWLKFVETFMQIETFDTLNDILLLE